MRTFKPYVFATHNKNKLEEVRALITFKIASLWDVGLNQELSETGSTIKENAFQKASFVFKTTGLQCFADDTGLEVEALGGAPGVYSARYASLPEDFEKRMIEGNIVEFTEADIPSTSPTYEQNVERLLLKLKGVKAPRRACFKTVICFLDLDQKARYFEGKIEGEILLAPEGKGGFGYDSIFKPDGVEHSYACMTLKDKNKISHRALAVSQLVEYFNNEA